MNWNKLESTGDLDSLIKKSEKNICLIMKYSTRCASSAMVHRRLERDWNEEEMNGTSLFFLDIIGHREISNAVSDVFNVRHESPQIILIDKGKSIYDTSHFMISYDSIKEAVNNLEIKNEN